MKNNKSLGQHWLKNRAILDEIAEFAAENRSESALEASESRLCLEIGPGLGTLTSSLLRLFPRVLAIEFDQNLAKNLPNSFPGKSLEVKNQDFLQFDLNSIKEPYVIAGNIPYYITSPIIMKILETDNKPDRAVLLIQKEVAERIAALSGKNTYLSLAVQNLADVSLGPVVERGLFTPPPKVDSQIIILDPRHTPVITEDALKVAKRAFSAPRKKLVKNLSSFYPADFIKEGLGSLGLSIDCRPADLSLEDWQKLADFIHKRYN